MKGCKTGFLAFAAGGLIDEIFTLVSKPNPEEYGRDCRKTLNQVF
jgi:hypothetical protein